MRAWLSANRTGPAYSLWKISEIKYNQSEIKNIQFNHNISYFNDSIKSFSDRNPNYKIYEILELNYYKNQTLNLLIPSKKCKMPTPRTIFFKSEVRNEKEYKNINLEKIMD